jgi:hypothetical protein
VFGLSPGQDRFSDVEAISGGKFHVPHFTGKAKVDRIVKEAGFANHQAARTDNVFDTGIFGGAYHSGCLLDLVDTFFPKISD